MQVSCINAWLQRIIVKDNPHISIKSLEKKFDGLFFFNIIWIDIKIVLMIGSQPNLGIKLPLS